MSDWDMFGTQYDHPLYEGRPSIYVIACTPRCGSHYLGHLLMRTGEFGSPLEYLNPEHLKSLKQRLSVSSTEDCFRELWRHRTSPNGWFGIKLHWRQVRQLPPDDRTIEFLDVNRYIRIQREDILDQAISYVIANQSGSFISFRERKREPQYDSTLIQNALSDLEEENRCWDRFFAMRKLNPLMVDYDRLCANPDEVVASIRSKFGFSGNPATPMKFDLPQKQSSSLNLLWRDRFLRERGAID